MTNSSYTVIYSPVTVAAAENHWSEEYVNDMASRLIIKRPESFIPDGSITRGEFAEYIVNALGIFRPVTANEVIFSDVKISDEQYNAIAIATEYGIIKGYTDGTFKPSAKISREEAMVMYAAAIDIVNIKETYNNRIDSYKDASLVSEWAYGSVCKTLNTGVFNGKSIDTIDPKGDFTYAEAATAIRNLLVESGLINE